MKALSVDFAPRWQVPRWVWMVLIGLLLGIAAERIWLGLQMESRARAFRREVAAMTTQLRDVARLQYELQTRLQAQPPYAKDALDIANMARFELSKMLGSLEAAQVEGVRVTAVEASATDGAVKVELEFSTHEALLRHLEEINAGEPRRRWSLVQAQSSPITGLGAGSITSRWSKDDSR